MSSRFLSQSVIADPELDSGVRFDLAFHGRFDIDDRSTFAVDWLRARSRSSHKARYEAKNFALCLGDEPHRIDSLDQLPLAHRAKSIALDATTLEFPEILYLLRAYQSSASPPACTIFYVEPAEYDRKDPAATATFPGNMFNLSSGFAGENCLPLYGSLLSGDRKAHVVAFLGYEGDRLRRLLNQDDGYFYSRVTLAFGVPPYQPGWELHALRANLRLLERDNTTVRYCGANNPYSAEQLLATAHKGLAASGLQCIAIAPFGTKPMAVGAAVYCVDHQSVRPLYDFPVRRVGRTKGVGSMHAYSVMLSN